MNGTITPSRDIARLIEIMAALRTPVTGCPWDLAQNFASIAPYTLEEAYEVADAIQRGDLADLKDELGDLLLQVVYHARMAQETGAFEFGDVVEGVTRKMIRRHPHVFGDETARSPGEVDGLWARIKAEERAEKTAARALMASQALPSPLETKPSDISAGAPLPSPLEGEVPRSGGGRDADADTQRTSLPLVGRARVGGLRDESDVLPISSGTAHSGISPTTPSEISPTPYPSPQGGGGFPSILADVPIALPALSRAIKLQDKAAKVGFDWPSLLPVFDKLREELAELEEVALPHDPRAPLPWPQPGEDDGSTSLPPVGRARVGGLRDESDVITASSSTAHSGSPPTAPSGIPPTPSPSPQGGGGSAIFEEFGDLLFVMANVARHLKIDPEAALRAANQKFVRRFTYIERQLAAKGSSPAQSSLVEMDELWDEAKAREKSA
jgi:ATP diphosphatase